ncbi:MAG: MBL fold metallo-hydrolase [Myxococcales bacterium]|nr:MBL fold metallo-hydrolase [Myxococcales bacterium]
MALSITFAGAADTVTGSCHLVELNGHRILLDCGMFQGPPEIEDRNAESFPFDPGDVDIVLLSHAHLDHTGRLPLLVKRGFRGKILSTAATRDLARVILLDSASIQAQDLDRAQRKGASPKELGMMDVLYTERDVFETMSRFRDPVRYEEPIDLGDGLSATYHDAGHIMGSAFIELESSHRGNTTRLTFSGDLGNVDKPIIRDPQPRQMVADVVLMESTYGARDHKPFAESVAELKEIVSATFANRGVVVIPSFALERSQELLYVLEDMVRSGRFPGLRVYLDSPMAIEVTHIFARHPDCLDDEVIAILRKGGNPFEFPGLKMTPTTQDSMQINDDTGPAIIISASGMCTGGRILHHLRHRLPVANNRVAFIGYQAEGTLGRRLVEGDNPVRIFRKDVAVEAEIHTIGGFSGHAGRSTLLGWLESVDLPGALALVHGEQESKQALAAEIAARHGLAAHTPEQGSSWTP